MTEFTIGSQWKTCGGWRAVVVDYNGSRPVFWHSKDQKSLDHDIDGYETEGYAVGQSVNMLDKNAFEPEPWKEPVVHEGWINIRTYFDDGGDQRMHWFETKDGADNCRSCADRIACIPIKFTEGEGL